MKTFKNAALTVFAALVASALIVGGDQTTKAVTKAKDTRAAARA